ncbi:MAG TPA: hypothetical protein VGQ06_00495 [Gemmatimonadales bacterium]|jgi:hypothetical protein|nr:hypothetical protein [Gemmatimonadales bacterium]
MNHPHEDDLLLLAYGELPDAHTAELEGHLGACATCRGVFERFERSRVALEVAVPRARRWAARWVAAALAAAAVVAVVVLARPEPPRNPEDGWRPATAWSATAGYIAGGAAVVEIDAKLTRLEKERSYVLPN